jgi:hypothetical protein
MKPQVRNTQKAIFYLTFKSRCLGALLLLWGDDRACATSLRLIGGLLHDGQPQFGLAVRIFCNQLTCAGPISIRQV